MWKLIALLVAIFSLIVVSSIAQETNKNEELVNAQKNYQEQSLSISLTCDARQKAILSDYAKELDALEQTMAKKGNLNGVIIVRQEKADYKLTNKIPDTVNDQTPAELKAVREKCKGMITAVEVDKKRELAKLATLYIGKLEKMQESLTKAMKIDDALVVRNEIEQVKESGDSAVEEKGRAPVQPLDDKLSAGKDDVRNVQDAFKKNVSLIAPYPECYKGAPTDKLSVQYAVIEILKQVGVKYNFKESYKNTNPTCRQWTKPHIKNMECKKALEKILSPVHLKYIISNGAVVLQKD